MIEVVKLDDAFKLRYRGSAVNRCANCAEPADFVVSVGDTTFGLDEMCFRTLHSGTSAFLRLMPSFQGKPKKAKVR